MFARTSGGDEPENILNDLTSKADRTWKHALTFSNLLLLHEVLHDFIMCAKETDLLRQRQVWWESSIGVHLYLVWS